MSRSVSSVGWKFRRTAGRVAERIGRAASQEKRRSGGCACHLPRVGSSRGCCFPKLGMAYFTLKCMGAWYATFSGGLFVGRRTLREWQAAPVPVVSVPARHPKADIKRRAKGLSGTAARTLQTCDEAPVVHPHRRGAGLVLDNVTACDSRVPLSLLSWPSSFFIWLRGVRRKGSCCSADCVVRLPSCVCCSRRKCLRCGALWKPLTIFQRRTIELESIKVHDSARALVVWCVY